MSDFNARAKDWDEDPGRSERARAVAAAIRQQVPLSPTMKAFEYGCGTGLLSFVLQPELGTITLADSSPGMLEVLKGKIAAGGIKNMRPILLDLAVDPLPGERFDLAYTLMTLHHIPDTARILECLFALLEPGGTLCIADLDQEDGSFHSHEPGFAGHNGFGRTELRQSLASAGFGDIWIGTCYEVIKNGRRYPIFLAVANKP